MPVQKAKPTSPGRRFVVSLKKNNLHRGKPFKGLIEPKSKKGGRNNNGRITVRHQGGGHKRHYRVIDFKRNKLDIPAIVERIEYDPNRSANIALLKYADGERRYILCPSKMEIGTEIMAAVAAKKNVFSSLVPNSSVMGRLFASDVPNSPCKIPVIQLRYRVWGGRSNWSVRRNASIDSGVAAWPKMASARSPGNASTPIKISTEIMNKVITPRKRRLRIIFVKYLNSNYLPKDFFWLENKSNIDRI